MEQTPRMFRSAFLLALGLAACGGGGEDGGQPAGIGPAGGTVTGSNGASVVVPAGALAQETDLRIAEIGAASASLPAGVERVSAVYALTPHGTTFALPVVLTIPFDPGQVPAGRTVRLLKTTDAARAEWEVVAGATAGGTTVAGELTSFSDVLVSLVPAAPTITTEPADATVDAGQDATFAVVAQANGAPPLTYQWRRDGADVAGATSASYTLAAVTGADDGAQLSVVVGNGLGTATSRLATLTVNAAPSAGWTAVGPAVAAGGPVRLGGLAVSPAGRVAVAYVAGSSGIAGLVGELRVSEWDGAGWSQLGGALNLAAGDGPSVSPRSIAYDGAGRPVVAWLERLGLTLVVQRWNGAAWERLGNPLFLGGAATGDPQLVIDPVSDRPIVVITSGPHVTVREWTGSDWSPAGSASVATSLTGAILTVSDDGQRLLVTALGDDPGGTQLLARLHAPTASGQYTTQVGGPVVTTPFPASSFQLDLATDGARPYALVGDRSAGPMLVRRYSGSAWEPIGDDLGIRGTGVTKQLRVTPSGLPFLAFGQGAASSRRVDALWWDGAAWTAVASPNAASADVVGFALALGPSGSPYVATAERDPAGASQLASELRVRRLVAVTLSVVVAGPAGGGTVTAGGRTCQAGTTCELSLPAGATVALEAAPATGFALASWTGCDSVVGLGCTIAVGADATVTATFQ